MIGYYIRIAVLKQERMAGFTYLGLCLILAELGYFRTLLTFRNLDLQKDCGIVKVVDCYGTP